MIHTISDDEPKRTPRRVVLDRAAERRQQVVAQGLDRYDQQRTAGYQHVQDETVRRLEQHLGLR